MRLIHNMSIRKKLFASMLVILLVNFLLLVLLGGTLFQAFYEGNKVYELKKTSQRLVDMYRENTQQSWEELYDNIFTAEDRNSQVVIFHLGDNKDLDILYHSRMRNATTAIRVVQAAGSQPPSHSPVDSQGGSPADDTGDDRTPQTEPILMVAPPIFYPAISPESIDQLPELGIDGTIINTGDDQRGNNRISIITQLDDGLYLLLDTPKDYIASTAELAVRYSAVISIVVLFAGALALYYLAGKFTKPIVEIDSVAQKIAQMDFSSSCPAQSGGEIGSLAASINDMSAALQDNMNKLVTANQVLQNDLTLQQETDRMRRQFISDVSHDFKTPLTLIVSYAEAIRDQKVPERNREFCDIIAGEGNRLSRLVERLLRLSRLESGMDGLELSVFSLNQLLDDCVRSMHLLIEQKNITLRKQYCGATILEADYQKVEQVIANLLENAVKYSPKNGRITIATQLAEEGLCRISVENDGSQIDPHELENIFISFYRADPTRERSCQSYGLGLAIVKTIVDLHGQQCVAENTPTGVCFSFTMPVAVLDDAAQEE